MWRFVHALYFGSLLGLSSLIHHPARANFLLLPASRNAQLYWATDEAEQPHRLNAGGAPRCRARMVPDRMACTLELAC